jgi:hypothetical protein
MIISSSSPASLPTCPCGRPLGSGLCRCGRAFSAVAPRAFGVGASSVLLRPSRHAPCGLVASCFFRSFRAAASFARACPGLFGVVPPRIHMVGIRAGWIVRVPVSSSL